MVFQRHQVHRPNADEPTNFRPFGNIIFLSKIIETLVAVQVMHYLDQNSLLPNFQTGFRKGLSYTETSSLTCKEMDELTALVDCRLALRVEGVRGSKASAAAYLRKDIC